MTKKSSEIASRVQNVQERIASAAAKAGRRADDITLVGVTKTQSAEDVRALILAGVTTIGENRVQELLQKEPFLADLPHKAHLIGHLQKNKAKYLPGHIDMLESLDSADTAAALEKAWAHAEGRLDVLIEVNIGDETSKSGVPASELDALVERVLASEKLRLRGLMAIPPFEPENAVRTYFSRMYQLFIDIRDKKGDNRDVNVLSMGMSTDFELAISEGATMVRVGTALFGPRD